MSRRSKNCAVGIAIVLFSVSLFLSSIQAQNAAAPEQPAAAPKASAQAELIGPVLVAKIQGSLTTKNAKVGDTLTAKTLRAWKLPSGVDIPKGAKLIAKITLVQSKQAGGGNSMLTFRFDAAEVKGQPPIQIHGKVVAIGPSLGPKGSIGANSVMGRGGVGSSEGLDPNAGLGAAGARDENDIPIGSSLEGVAIGRHLDADWTTALRGVKQDIFLDSDVLIKIQFI